MANYADDILNSGPAPTPRASGAVDYASGLLVDQAAPAPRNLNGEGFVANPNTGQMTSQELLRQQVRPSVGGALASGYAAGGTLNAGDEIAGTVLSPFARERIRIEQKVQSEEHPLAFLTGQLAGGVMSTIPLFAGAKTGLGVAARAILGGGAIGGLDAFFSGEDMADRIMRVPYGVGGGMVGGAVSIPLAKVVSLAGAKYGPKVAALFKDTRVVTKTGRLTPYGRAKLEQLGFDPDEVTASFASAYERNVSQGLQEGQAANTAAMEAFGIPAYRANRTGSVDDFATQEAARRGGMGPANSQRAAEALGRQDEAMRRAADDIATDLGGGTKGDQWDAAVAVSERLKSMAEAEKQAAAALYKASEAAGVEIKPGLASGIASRLQTRLADEEVYIDLDAFPQARSFMTRLLRRGSKDEGVPLKMVDSLRKDLNRAITKAQPGTEDYRALSIIKEEYDKWFDDVVNARLFDGDIEGIENLKAAREAFSAYASKFRGNDAGSKFIQQMMDADASPDDMVRWLFSSGKLGSGKFNSTLAESLKKTLGPDSEEWNMVRQAAFRQLTEKPEGMTQWGPQAMSQKIGEFFTSPSTRSLSQAMFTREERANILLFKKALEQMTPPPGAVNYPNTSYELNRMGQRALNALMTSLGFAQGGPGGAAVANVATQSAGNVRGWLQTSRAFSQPPRTVPGGALTAPAAIGGSTATTERFRGQQR